MLDKMTGRSRGFGFVTFDTKEDMEECIAKLDKTELEGRRISVTRAIPQTEIAPGAPAHSLNGPGRRDKYWPRHLGFSPLCSHRASLLLSRLLSLQATCLSPSCAHIMLRLPCLSLRWPGMP